MQSRYTLALPLLIDNCSVVRVIVHFSGAKGIVIDANRLNFVMAVGGQSGVFAAV
jgi:hypothetical protein